MESLMDSKVRHELVQQMSSVSNVIPGTVGERREMRQELEAMVYQVEAETADLGMNGSGGYSGWHEICGFPAGSARGSSQ